MFYAFVILVIIFIAGGLWLRHFLYGQYIPESPVASLPLPADVGTNDRILLYGADSALTAGPDTISEHPSIYPRFVEIAREMRQQYGDRLDGFVHGGDIVSHYNDYELQAFTKNTRRLVDDRVPFLLATGNEEGERGRQALVTTGLLKQPEPYYVQDFRDFSVAVLDTELPLHRGTAQYRFLTSALQNTHAKQMLVIMHHPFITYGFHNNHIVEYKRKRFAKDIATLVQQNQGKIIAIIESDDHDYQRLDFFGIPIFVSGGLGEGLRATKRGPETQVAIDGTFHFLRILSNPRRVTVSAIRLNERGILGEIDHFTIDLPRGSANSVMK